MLKYWIWLKLAFKTANDRTDQILCKFGNPKEFYEGGEAAFQQISGLKRSELNALTKTSLKSAESVIAECKKKGITILTPDHPMYPASLLNIYATPLVLYAVGDLSVLSHPVRAAMVGSRKPTEYGVKAAYKLGYDLASVGVTIVSGSALGIDSVSHYAALQADGKSIAVLGCGLDVDYPKENRDLRRELATKGLVLSEYELRTPPFHWNFPMRNRILAGLSQGTIVVQAGERSGSLLTANYAIEQGKDIYVVPASIFNSQSIGGLNLLKECGYPITCAEDFIKNYIAQYPDELSPNAPMNEQNHMQSEELLQQFSKKTEENKSTKPKKSKAVKTDPKEEKKSFKEKLFPSKKNEVKPLSADADELAKSIYSLLQQHPCYPDELIAATGTSAGKVLTALTELEIEGYVVCQANGQFTLLS